MIKVCSNEEPRPSRREIFKKSSPDPSSQFQKNVWAIYLCVKGTQVFIYNKQFISPNVDFSFSCYRIIA